MWRPQEILLEAEAAVRAREEALNQVLNVLIHDCPERYFISLKHKF